MFSDEMFYLANTLRPIQHQLNTLVICKTCVPALKSSIFQSFYSSIQPLPRLPFCHCPSPRRRNEPGPLSVNLMDGTYRLRGALLRRLPLRSSRRLRVGSTRGGRRRRRRLLSFAPILTAPRPRPPFHLRRSRVRHRNPLPRGAKRNAICMSNSRTCGANRERAVEEHSPKPIARTTRKGCAETSHARVAATGRMHATLSTEEDASHADAYTAICRRTSVIFVILSPVRAQLCTINVSTAHVRSSVCRRQCDHQTH
jgi:hypothetical protein